MQSPNFPPPTVRSSNFELLRIFCMLSIVAVHYVWHGGSAASGSNIAAAYFLGNFAQIGVACFVLIGAWFLIDKEFSITRIFNLSKQITFYSLSIALLLFIIGMASYTDIIKNAMPIIFKRYWFLTPYVFLLFLHPFLNYVLNACSKKQIRFLCISLFIAVSVIPTIFIVTDPFGFNIFRFILLYLIAYAIKKECIRIEFKNNLLNFITSITVAFGMYSLSLLALRWNYTDFASLYPKMDHNHRQPRSRYLPVSIRIGHVPLPTQNDQMESGGGNSVVCKKIQAHFTTLSTHLLPLLPGIGLCKRRTFFHFYIFIPPFHIELLVGAQRFLVYRHVDSAIFLNSLLCPNNR